MRFYIMFRQELHESARVCSKFSKRTQLSGIVFKYGFEDYPLQSVLRSSTSPIPILVNISDYYTL